MRIRRVPEHLKIKVIKWFDYLWMTKKSSDDECVGFLPAKLKGKCFECLIYKNIIIIIKQIYLFFSGNCYSRTFGYAETR